MHNVVSQSYHFSGINMNSSAQLLNNKTEAKKTGKLRFVENAERKAPRCHSRSSADRRPGIIADRLVSKESGH
jgi:hypothetical protein